MSEISRLNGYDIKDKKAIRTFSNINELKSSNLKNNEYVKVIDIDSNFYISNDEDNERINILLSNGLYAILIDKVLKLSLLNLTNFNDLNNYNLQNINEIILDKSYSITNYIEFNNMIINLNNYELNPDMENHNNIILNSNNTIKNGKFVFSDTSQLTSNNGICIKIVGDNNIIDNIDFNGYYSVYSESSIDNIEIKNCLLNSFRHEVFFQIGKFTNINIHDNKQTREQDYETPVQHHNNIQIYNKCTFPGTSGMLTKDMILNEYGNNLTITNNEFNTINTRSINVINFHNVIIENNKTYNPFGDKTDHTLVGYSDDIYVCDLCQYGEIKNNLVVNSGENGIDLLSCKYFDVIGNKLVGTDITGIAIQVSDINTEGWLNADVDNDLKISENITCVGNTIKSCSVGISNSGRNITCNNNTIIRHEEYKDSVAFGLSSNTVLNTKGDYGTVNLTGNAIDSILQPFALTGGANTIFNNVNSNMILDESTALKVDFEIDNTDLTNDTDTKLVRLDHGLKFKHVKIYILNSENKPIEVPLCSGNNKGIINYDNQQSHFYMTVYKRFLNIPYNSGSSSYANLTSGTLKVVLY